MEVVFEGSVLHALVKMCLSKLNVVFVHWDPPMTVANLSVATAVRGSLHTTPVDTRCFLAAAKCFHVGHGIDNTLWHSHRMGK